MNKKIIISFALATLISSVAIAQNTAEFKWYGFIRNYFAYDSRECVSGTADMFSYLPKDMDFKNDIDQNAQSHFNYTSITSRLGLDVSGYQYNNWNFGAKIEADFYAGLSGVTGTATLRLRQAYLTASKNDMTYKVGQAWHPMAADFPDVFSLNTGAPFGPFSRTPLVQLDYKIDKNYSLTAAAIWQMQYTSAGPNGASANYIKYSQIPELFLGLSWKRTHFSSKVGVNMLSIKPRNRAANGAKALDRITTFGAFAYINYTKNDFSLKSKTYFGEGGEHLGLNSGYAVAYRENVADNQWFYTPYRNLSSWISLKYGKQLQGVLFAGYVKNYGTKERIMSKDYIYFSKNSFATMNQMWRLTPSLVYNMGKFQIGLEYEITSVQYGKWNDTAVQNYINTLADSSSSDKTIPAIVNAQFHGLATNDLHWITNHRVQLMLKYTF